MEKGKLIVLEDRVPKLKEQRKSKANKRLVFYLSLFFILILLIVYSQSSLSSISKIAVAGNKYVNDKEIVSMSELSTKTSYWKVDKKEVEEMLERHPEIKKVSIDKAFPNKVTINVTEYKRVAYVVEKGKYFPINEAGKVLDAVKGEPISSDAPLLINWKDAEAIQELVQELSKVPKSITNAISEMYHTPTDFEPMHIRLFMNDGREVSAKISNFSDKIVLYPSVVKELSPDQRGVIDLEERPTFIPYEKEKGDEKSEGEG
ncbi:cell division protein FtsQ/DivIB [Metabacillus iocasae]|uniref:Cell division protein DivIB n=1 Tax=Priestia iocasae TaxID=2291674 RepID=A0ABS2QQP0_9BACI|nr:FtsQ-type POTRA domain-containing protein [Metabacillus iocasae]MBM7701775.1 cell division protein FtsQ [Metabacillus iocasae]